MTMGQEKYAYWCLEVRDNKKKKKKEEIIQDNDEGDDSSKLITVDDLQEAHQDFFFNLFKTYSYCTKARKERLYHVG